MGWLVDVKGVLELESHHFLNYTGLGKNYTKAGGKF